MTASQPALPKAGFLLARRAWADLRHLALCLLLIAFTALVPQAPAEAAAEHHSVHPDHSGMTSHCAGHQKAQAPDTAPDCTGAAGLCCQACLAVALPAGSLPLDLPQARESFRQEVPILRTISPERLLRPPQAVIL